MSRDVFVVVEHRQGAIRDITFELLAKGRQLADGCGGTLWAILIGADLGAMADSLRQAADRVAVVEAPGLAQFHSDHYQHVLTALLQEHRPLFTLMGHTSYGWELAPCLSAALGIPLAPGCIDIWLEGEVAICKRMVYGGKIVGEYSLRPSWGYLVTFPAGTFPAVAPSAQVGVVARQQPPHLEEIAEKVFVRMVESPAGEVDICQSQKIVAVGRGIREREHLRLAEELAKTIGAVVACSRPIVDAGWLPKDRQVGSSGKTVRPKLYLAIGISGDFQHVMGMKGAETIIAINKDPNAPIFSVAHYGVVDDLFKVVPALTTAVQSMSAK